jgi:hypothetical protein
MTSLAAHCLALALLVPAVAGPLPDVRPTRAAASAEKAHAAPEQVSPALGLQAHDAAGPVRVLDGAHRPPEQNQVRIERRVTVRISPSPEAQRERLLSALPRRPIRTTFAEEDHGECVPIASIAGVQPSEDDDRLLLFLRDRRVLSAELERSCSAQAFYSGFYVERSEDGQLCVERDRLQSRSGASCQLEELHRLVAVRD